MEAFDETLDDVEQVGYYGAEDHEYHDNGADYDYASEDYLDQYDEDETLSYETDFADDLDYLGSEELGGEIAELQEMLYEATEGLTPEETEEFYGEFLGALAGAIPAIIGAAPSIVKGIGGLFKGRRRPRRPRRPRPRYRPRPRPRHTAGGIASLSRKLDQLIRILSQRR